MTSQFANMTSSLVFLTLVCFSCQSLITGPRFLAISWLVLSSETLWKYLINAMIYFIATTNIDFIDLIFQVRQWSLVMSQTRTKGIYTGYQNLRLHFTSFVRYLSGYQNICHKHIRGKKTCSYLRTEKKRAKQKNKKTYIYITK